MTYETKDGVRFANHVEIDRLGRRIRIDGQMFPWMTADEPRRIEADNKGFVTIYVPIICQTVSVTDNVCPSECDCVPVNGNSYKQCARSWRALADPESELKPTR